MSNAPSKPVSFSRPKVGYFSNRPRTYIHTYTHTYILTYIQTYIHTYILTYIQTYIHTYIHTDIHTYLHTYRHTYIHTYLRTHIHTYILTYTQTYLPVVAERLKMKINITKNFTSVVTGNGNIRSYIHRFKIIEKPICPCGTKDQTIDYLLLECELLNRERDRLILTVSKTDIWPISKNELIRKHFKLFTKFTNEISFDKLNEV